MKWIKTSEKKSDDGLIVFFRIIPSHGIPIKYRGYYFEKMNCYVDDGDIKESRNKPLSSFNIEWLDESTPTTPSAMEEALREAIKQAENNYNSAKASADWFNNNTPGVGQTIDYQSYEPLPSWVIKAKASLSAHLSEDGWVEIKQGCEMPKFGKDNMFSETILGFDAKMERTEVGELFKMHNNKYSLYHLQQHNYMNNVTHWQPLPKPPIH